MFQGNFTITQTDDGFIRGTFTGETPAGPFDVNLVAPLPFRMDGSIDGDETRALANEIAGECLETAGYFPLKELVGKGPAVYAKKLLKRMHSKVPEVKSKAWKDYKVLCAKSKAGQSRAMDICYAIARLKQDVLARRQRGKGGPTLSLDLLGGFDYREVMDEVHTDAVYNPNARSGVQLFRNLNKKQLRPRAMRLHRKLKWIAKENPSAEEIVQTVRTLSRAELEKRRQLRQGMVGASMMGGFNFNAFIKDVGKVAGKIAKKLAPIAKKIPLYGEFVSPALKTVGEALSPSKKKRKKAKRKIRRVRRLARSGNPKAMRAEAALIDALKIRRAHAITQGIRSGAIKTRKPRRRKAPVKTRYQRKGPIVAKALADDPKMVSAYYAGSYAGLRRSSKVFGKGSS
jgi:hypothetical protein